ncbi:MAG: hypothetical protein S4CHLAM6_11320 [Chlamydiae bacterium]|nr:hypothetical protein [Chlamydiota bacterium]
MERHEIENFVKSLIEVVWEKFEEEKIGNYYHEDLEGFYNDDKVTFELLTKKLKVFQNHMQSHKVEIKDLIIEEESFALHALQKFNPEGKEISIQTILIAHLKEGKILKYWLKTEMPLEFN